MNSLSTEFQWPIMMPRKEQIRYMKKKKKRKIALKDESTDVTEKRILIV